MRKILLFTFCIGLFYSCKKEGPPGKDGNANVVSSTVTVTNWVYSAPSYVATISYAAITQEIINSGAVLVYVESGTNSYTQLPLTFYQNSSYSTTLEVENFIGGLRIFWTDSDLTQPNTPPSVKFKIVVIASSNLKTLPAEFNLRDYEKVVEYFNIK